jgi:hypothetical protein
MLREVSHKSKRTYVGYEFENMSNGRSQAMTMATCRHVIVEGAQRKQDDRSDKSILGDGRNGDVVVVTSEVRIDYRGDEESQYESEKRESHL